MSRDVKWLERKYGEEKNVKPSIISNVYQDIKGFEEIDDDDTTTTNSDEENSTNKSDTDEEIEAITKGIKTGSRWYRHRTRNNAWSYTTTNKRCYTISGRKFRRFL